MHASTSVYQCLFCEELFSSASSKNDHILEHFTRETCFDCNRNVLRIGDKRYIVHDAITCVKKDVASDEAVEKAKPSESATSPDDAKRPSKNQYLPDVNVQNEICIASDPNRFEEVLIKLEAEEEETDTVQAHGEQEIIEVEVVDENSNRNENPEYIIIDLNDIPLVREQSTDQSQEIPQPNTKQITKCDVCEQEFGCVFFLESHRKLKHPTAANKIDSLSNSDGNTSTPIVAAAGKSPGKGIKSIVKPKPKTERPIERLECLLCNKSYKTQLSLRKHIDTIHDPNARKFKCDLCESAFFREAALQNHHENQHLDMKKFTCAICSTSVKSKLALERHMFQHMGKKPYKCTWEDCKKTFSCSANLKEHMRSHTGEKPFVCGIDGCENRYTFAADIRKHKYKIHNIFPKKFPCQICAQVFPQRAMLKKHLKKHSNKH